MSLLLFSDLHLDQYRRFSTILEGGLNSRLLKQIATVNKLKKIAEEIQPTAIFFLGDLFNGQGANINKQLYLIGYNLVNSLKEIAPLYLLVGNHDIYGSYHILEPMKTKNIEIVSNTTLITLEGLSITLIPWGKPFLPEGEVCLGHLDIEGAKTGIGYSLPGTIHPAELRNYKLVICGHFHSYQKIDPNIVVCGAIMANDFGDCEEDYGAILLHPDLTYERLIIDSPKFLQATINTQQDLDKFVANYSSRNYYKLITTDRKINIPKFNYKIEIEWDIQEEPKTRLEYAVTDSLEDILTKYILQCNTKIDKEQAITILKEVFSEC